MSKAMTQATAGHNLRVMMAIVALAALLLVLTLVAVLQRAPTTSTERGEANPAMSAESKGGPRSVGYDPTIDRGEANPAISAEGKGGSTSTNDDPIERHAEVVQRLGNGSLR